MEKKNLSYDQAIGEIEKIIAKLQGNDSQCSFDEVIGEVERAVKLLNSCKEKLVKTEERMNKLFDESTEQA